MKQQSEQPAENIINSKLLNQPDVNDSINTARHLEDSIIAGPGKKSHV